MALYTWQEIYHQAIHLSLTIYFNSVGKYIWLMEKNPLIMSYFKFTCFYAQCVELSAKVTGSLNIHIYLWHHTDRYRQNLDSEAPMLRQCLSWQNWLAFNWFSIFTNWSHLLIPTEQHQDHRSHLELQSDLFIPMEQHRDHRLYHSKENTENIFFWAEKIWFENNFR